MKTLLKIKIALSVVIIVALAGLTWWLFRGTSIQTEHETQIEETPVEIEQIRSIGEWEFLSVSDEELVDTIRHGFFGDDELARIYYGTLRFGINLSEATDEWISHDGDTVVVTLPSVKLLDANFLDEARTKSFVEDGKWTPSDRAALTAKARRMMLKRCMTPANINRANEKARQEVKKLLEGMLGKPVKLLTSNS